MISQERALVLVSYDFETGIFVWKLPRAGVKCGQQAGYLRPDGYLQIRLDKERYLAHRLAWFIFYGYWPNQIDHINRARADNRIVNLRNVSLTENHYNSKMNKRNSTGYRGVFKTANDRFYVQFAGKYIGTYDSPEEASAVFRAKIEEEIGQGILGETKWTM